MRRLADQLVEAMFFARAAPLPAPVRGEAGFEQAFTSRGPRDSSGRSSRDFDLKTRLFRYPLSYVIHSDGFGALPDETRRYICQRLDAILDGSDSSITFSHLSAADRTAIREILVATQPQFARHQTRGRGAMAGPAPAFRAAHNLLRAGHDR